MTIQEASIFFNNLKTKSNNNYRIKIYKNFLYILNSLQNKDLSKDEIQSIEIKFDILDLESHRESNQRELNKILKEFTDYLREKHSILKKGYYMNIGVSIGSVFGLIAGILIKERMDKSIGVALGIVIGVTIGIIIGKILDAKVKAEGKDI